MSTRGGKKAGTFHSVFRDNDLDLTSKEVNEQLIWNEEYKLAKFPVSEGAVAPHLHERKQEQLRRQFLYNIIQRNHGLQSRPALDRHDPETTARAETRHPAP